MKKVLYALLAIILIGSVSFGLSRSDLLKGNGWEVATTQNPDADSNRNGDDLTLDGSYTGTGGGKTIPFDPTDGGLNIPDPNDLPDCDPEYYIDLYVESITGTDLDDLSSSDFTIYNSSGTDVTITFSLDDSNKSTGRYKFDYNGTNTDDDFEIEINPDGYKSTTVSVQNSSTCSDVRFGFIAEIAPNHAVKVIDHNGDNITDATVKTGTNYRTTCEYYSPRSVYLCTTKDSSDEQYRASVTGYANETGSLENSVTYKPLFNTSLFGRASIIAAAGSSATSGAQYQTGVATDAISSGAASYNPSTTYETYEGTIVIDETIEMDRFAWSLQIYDSGTYASIEDADVEITAGGTTTECSNDDTTENSGIYWCSETSYYSSTGSIPTFTISADGYESVSDEFQRNRDSRTDGVAKVVYLDESDTTDPASYCESVTISSPDLPLAYDASALGEITIDVEVSATNSAFESTIYTKVYSGDGTLSDGENTVTGSTDTYLYEDISGITTDKSYTYSNGAIGDEIYVTAADGCNNTFEITQDDPPTGDEEYELACTDADITPDSYEIYLSANSSTLHEFELEWTIIEQLIAVQTAPEWIKRSFAFKHQNNPLLYLADESTYDALTLTIGTTGNGDFYYSNDLTTTYTELSYEFTAADSDTVTFYYSGADGGDSLYVTSSDSGCSDSLSLTEEAEEDDEPEIDYNYSHDEEDIDFEEIEDIDECDEYPFTDVDDDDEMTPYINCLAQTGAIQGYGDGSFGPYNYITYAEVIKIVVAMTGEPLANVNDPTGFIDIDGHWAERYIKTAEALDIARPYETVYFNPDAPASRGGVLVFLARGANETIWGWDRYDIPVSDADITDWYTYALILAFDAEAEIPGVGTEYITEGYSDGTFKGDNPIRRDEAAAMLIRAFYAWYL